MQDLWFTIFSTAAGVAVTLVVTLIFNKVIAMPAALKKQREAGQKEVAALRTELMACKAQVAEMQEVIDALPGYRAQSLRIQNELRAADNTLLSTCQAIQDSLILIQTSNSELRAGVEALQIGQDQARASLARLEESEKDSLRLKIIQDYRIFADVRRNPELAWSEMEYHAFKALVEDYEAHGGNDYVHDTVLPAMNELEIVPMANLRRLEEIMTARHAF